MKSTTLRRFREMARLEEQVIRAVMPRLSAADPEPLLAYAAPTAGEVVTRRDGSRLVKRSFTFAEVAHA